MHALVRYLMIGSLLAAALAWWLKDDLPAPVKLQVDMLGAPAQAAVRRKPFEVTANGVDYRIQPRYSYDINAVVTSLHHSDAWWDYAHKEWNDHVNVMDLCLVWGENVRGGAYREGSYSNTQWECYVRYRGGVPFNLDEMSNNHIVTADPAVARELRKIRIGDQIRLQGYLVDYTVLKNGQPSGTRVSSEVRTDQGNGACEVIYIESFEKLASPNRRWRAAWWSALGVLLCSVIAWMFLPVKFNDG